MIGVGGIGWGRFFAVRCNHTLGREESHLGRFLGRRAHRKPYVVAYYVKALLGLDFTVIPIGKVGEDGAGARLIEDLASKCSTLS